MENGATDPLSDLAVSVRSYRHTSALSRAVGKMVRGIDSRKKIRGKSIIGLPGRTVVHMEVSHMKYTRVTL